MVPICTITIIITVTKKSVKVIIIINIQMILFTTQLWTKNL